VLRIEGARSTTCATSTSSSRSGCSSRSPACQGSGKSTLVEDILHKALWRGTSTGRACCPARTTASGARAHRQGHRHRPEPIGRTPRSNPATYTGLFTPIRELFAEMPEAKIRGYGPGRFSFNVKGGRCEACEGDGLVKIEMHFLPDVYVPCDVCKGQALQPRDAGGALPRAQHRRRAGPHGGGRAGAVREPAAHRAEAADAERRGLGYIHLGQSATTLSGGEAQRVKLATELSKRDTGRTLYILDEPTTGLHFEDVRMLLDVLHRLVDRGNTVLVIEHNLDVIKTADWIVDLGPEGGVRGGTIVAAGARRTSPSRPRPAPSRAAPRSAAQTQRRNGREPLKSAVG
jgi:excinuclease ABC subunit A